MKRLISLVLVAALSFFSFMVYAEDPGNGNTGVLPTTLVGTLNFADGEAMSVFLFSDFHFTIRITSRFP